MKRYRIDRRSMALAGLGALLLAAVACTPQDAGEAPAEQKAERHENADLGIALADVPAPFAVRSSDAESIVLAPEGMDGELTIHVHEPGLGGVNLVAATEEHKARIEGLADGAYSGQRELGSQLGTAFYSRGRYTDEAGAGVEETLIFTVHPSGDRILELAYRYPGTADSRERIEDHLFAVLGELEPLAPADAG